MIPSPPSGARRPPAVGANGSPFRYSATTATTTTTTGLFPRVKGATAAASSSSLASQSAAVAASASYSMPQQSLLSQLNLDTYESIKISLLVAESHQMQLELKGKSRKSGASSSSAAARRHSPPGKKTTSSSGRGGGVRKAANGAHAEVRSVRWEQNETVARREQLADWVRWLRVALRAFASPAAAIEVFVRRTHELCAAGIDKSKVPPDMVHHLDDLHEFEVGGSPRSVSRTMMRQQHRHMRRLSLPAAHPPNPTSAAGDGNGNGNEHDDDEDDDNAFLEAQREQAQSKRSCEVLSTLASLVALLALGEAWNEGFVATNSSLLPALAHHHQQQHQQDRGRSLKSLIRAVCDDLASGVFFTPPSLGCATPEDVVSSLGGARAFSDVFNDMLSVAVFHRDRAETCRYLEIRREKVLSRCIHNFRQEHARAALRVWRYYTVQQVRKRKRLWQKLVRARELYVTKQSIDGWRRFATHVHLASIHSANQRNEAVLGKMRAQIAGLQERIAKAEADGAQWARDKAESQQKLDAVEVRNTKSRERAAAAGTRYLAVRRDWADVVKALFNDDERVPHESGSAAAKRANGAPGSPTAASAAATKKAPAANTNLATFAPITDAPPASTAAGAAAAAASSSELEAQEQQHRSWQAGSKAVRWAKWLLGVYAPGALKNWEAEASARAKLQQAGRMAAAAHGAELDDKFGEMPYVSIAAVRELLEVLVLLHVRNPMLFLGPQAAATTTTTTAPASPTATAAGAPLLANDAGSGNLLSVGGGGGGGGAFPLRRRVSSIFEMSFNPNSSTNSSSANNKHYDGSRGLLAASGILERSTRRRSTANGGTGSSSGESSFNHALLRNAAASALVRHALAEDVWDLYSELCDTGALQMEQRNVSTIDELLAGRPPRTEMHFVDAPIRRAGDDAAAPPSGKKAEQATKKPGKRHAKNKIDSPLSPTSPRTITLLVPQIGDGDDHGDATDSSSSSDDDDDDDEKKKKKKKDGDDDEQDGKTTVARVGFVIPPPISLTDLIRQDQMRLLLLLVHLAQLWCGGYCGAFFLKSRDPPLLAMLANNGNSNGSSNGVKSNVHHDRYPTLVQSRLAQQPRPGKLATIEETEDMMADWSQGVQALAAVAAGGGSSGDSALFQVGLDEAMRDCIEHGEASMFRQTLQQLFDLLTLGDTIDQPRMEQLVLCICSEERRAEHEAAVLAAEQQQQKSRGGGGTLSTTAIGSKAQDATQRRSAGYLLRYLSSESGAGLLQDHPLNPALALTPSGAAAAAPPPRVAFAPWPSGGVSNVSELGLYISETAVHLGYGHSNRRVVAEKLVEVLLQSSQVAFAQSVFAPSERLREELAQRQPRLAKVFNEFAIVSRASNGNSGGGVKKVSSPLQQKQHHLGQVGRSAVASPTGALARQPSLEIRLANLQQNATTAANAASISLVFSRKSYQQWLDQHVVRVFGNEFTPQGRDAEAIYSASVAYSPERDMALLELLVCATASFVYPSPFVSTEEKVLAFCAKLFGDY